MKSFRVQLTSIGLLLAGFAVLVATGVGTACAPTPADQKLTDQKEVTWPAFRYRLCDTENACPSGFSCKSGRCISTDNRYIMTTAECVSADECGRGMACISSACVVDMIQCVDHSDCLGDEVCFQGACIEEKT